MNTSRQRVQRKHGSGLRGKSQSGIALLVILLIVAIVSILATEMMARLQINVARTVNIKDNNQAYWYAVGAEQFAEKSLNALKTLSPDNMNLGQPWAQVFKYPITGGGIQAELIDLQSCFNLNTVVLPESSSGVENLNAAAKSPAQGFFNLIRLSTEDIDSYSAETLRDSLKDWLDADNDISGYGAEDADYQSLRFPYVAANALMTNKSELRLVNGIEMDNLRDLLPHVCVIPDLAFNTMEININTVKEENAHIIAAMLNLNLDATKRIIASRPVDGFADTNDFLSEPEIVAKELTAEQKAWFVIKTNYFMLLTKTRYNNASFKMVSIFKLDSEGKGVSVISREFGGIN
ncbi:MAG: general secretion pathway protein K [Gammaproteobacteria bacterium]|jgi:general secretion pathway protein K